MSINHDYSPNTTPWWTQHQHQHQQQEVDAEEEEDDAVLGENTRSPPPPQRETEIDEKEAMFEKPLTPSDVGKLNRLVIPKQHAERYFPLDSAGESKGLLLSFEDESGKCWRFRYSYWNSSQSYVLTKGWSRYVKDKRLDAGDVVLFHRHRSLSQRFFITWRRRHPTPKAHISNSNVNGWTSGLYPAHPYPYPTHHHHPLSYHQTHDFHAGGGSQSTIVAGGNSSSSSTSSSRVLRLFGVNMECQPDNNNNNNIDSETYNNNMLSTQGTATPQFYSHDLHRQSSNPHTHSHMVRQQPY